MILGCLNLNLANKVVSNNNGAKYIKNSGWYKMDKLASQVRNNFIEECIKLLAEEDRNKLSHILNIHASGLFNYMRDNDNIIY